LPNAGKGGRKMIKARNSPILRTIPLMLIAVCLLSFPGLAQFAGGTGEADDPFQITTAEQLASIGQDPDLLDKCFALVNDIDLDPNLPGGRIFTQSVIAPDVDPAPHFQGAVFTGSFDGNGYTIRHLTIHGGGAYYIGLFGKIGSAGKVHDLRLQDIRVSSSGSSIAGLAGYSRGSITNCYLSGSVSGGTGEWCSYLGLVTGYNSGTIRHCSAEGSVSSGSTKRGTHLGLLTAMNRGTISYCDTKGTVTTGDRSWGEIGGLVGENLRSISDCYSAASISVVGDDAGGLVGSNRGAVNRCYATGDVSCGRYSDDAGGLVGYNAGSIVGCYASGDVSGPFSNWRLGGLVGWNWGNIVHCYATGRVIGDGARAGLVGENWGNIAHCYAAGWLLGDYLRLSYDVGGLVGDNTGGVVDRCFWDTETTGLAVSAEGRGLTTVQMQDGQTFLASGWDFVGERANGTADMWRLPEGGGYPLLTVFSDDHPPHELEGAGTADEPYRIATPEDLGAICHYDTMACYELVDDIDLYGITWTTAPIPTFKGKLDGRGFVLSNLTIHGGDHLGLFGVLEKDAVVENLGIEDANIIGGNSANGLGILAAENWGRIANCHITGNVSGENYEQRLGGIVGYNCGTITNCYPVDYSGPYSVIITDQEATRQFLVFEGIDFDQVWIPEQTDLEDLESILRTYLDSDSPIQAQTWIDHEYILANLPRYDREYSGFILDDSKYIICNMVFLSVFKESCYIAEYEDPPGSRFTIIFDGGCGAVRVIFDAESKAIVSMDCNGMGIIRP
jgi:hypothetical protein